MTRTTRRDYRDRPIRDGQHGRRCPSPNCDNLRREPHPRQRPRHRPEGRIMTTENTDADRFARDLALASMVALRVDNIGDTCPAWLVGDERKCGKRPTVGSLCARHAKVAEKRLAERAEAQAAMAAAMADKRARLMPEKRARLAEVEAQLARHPLPADRAAYTGNVAASIVRRGERHLSDANVSRMAALHREAEALRAWLRGEA